LARNPSRCALRWAPVKGSAASDRSTGPDPPAPAPTTSNHRRSPMPDTAHLNQTAPADPTSSSTPKTAAETPPYGGQATGAAAGGAKAHAAPPRRGRTLDLIEAKAGGRRWAVLASYDDYAAAIVDTARVGPLLVG